MRPDGGVRLKLDEKPRAVVIPLALRAATLGASTVQKSRRPAIEASELALVAITFLLMSVLFAVAHRVVQRPWSATISPPIPTTMAQSISLNRAEGESVSRTVQ